MHTATMRVSLELLLVLALLPGSAEAVSAYWFCAFMPHFCDPPRIPFDSSPQRPVLSTSPYYAPSADPTPLPINAYPPSQLHSSPPTQLLPTHPNVFRVPPALGACNSNPTTNTNSQFNIGFSFNKVPDDHQKLFVTAANKWKGVIIGDIFDASLVWGLSRCGRWPMTVDDLHICVAYEDIDGPDGTLAFGRPILRRGTSDSPLPVTGESKSDSCSFVICAGNMTNWLNRVFTVVFDIADAGGVRFAETIVRTHLIWFACDLLGRHFPKRYFSLLGFPQLHEMGHVVSCILSFTIAFDFYSSRSPAALFAR
jgi:hypothetical protein